MGTKIIIVEDHPLMQKGIEMTLDAEMDFEVVGAAVSAEQALEFVSKVNPDLAIIDISLPGMNGIELIKHFRTHDPDLLMLVVSRHDEELFAERAIRAGARGYIMKMQAGEQLVEAVRKILKGGFFLSDKMSNKILMEMVSGGPGRKAASPYERLSDRELEVFRMIGQGKATRDIARRLHVSSKTIDSYKARIKEKLNIGNSSNLLQEAVQWVKEREM
ncbi:MAG: response regulator transcription factor [Balneolales bacterium]